MTYLTIALGDTLLYTSRYVKNCIQDTILPVLKNGFSVILGMCLFTTVHEHSEVVCQILYGSKWKGRELLILFFLLFWYH